RACAAAECRAIPIVPPGSGTPGPRATRRTPTMTVAPVREPRAAANPGRDAPPCAPAGDPPHAGRDVAAPEARAARRVDRRRPRAPGGDRRPGAGGAAGAAGPALAVSRRAGGPG